MLWLLSLTTEQALLKLCQRCFCFQIKDQRNGYGNMQTYFRAYRRADDDTGGIHTRSPGGPRPPAGPGSPRAPLLPSSPAGPGGP